MRQLRRYNEVYQQWENLIRRYPDSVDPNWLDPNVVPVSLGVIDRHRYVTPIMSGGFERFCKDMTQKTYRTPKPIRGSYPRLCLQLHPCGPSAKEDRGLKESAILRHKDDLDILQAISLNSSTLMFCMLLPEFTKPTPIVDNEIIGEGNLEPRGLFSRSCEVVLKARKYVNSVPDLIEDAQDLTRSEYSTKPLTEDYHKTWIRRYRELEIGDEVEFVLGSIVAEDKLINWFYHTGLIKGEDYYLESYPCLNSEAIHFVSSIPKDQVALHEWRQWNMQEGEYSDRLTPDKFTSPMLHKINKVLPKTSNKNTFSEDFRAYGDYRLIRIIRLTNKRKGKLKNDR